MATVPPRTIEAILDRRHFLMKAGGTGLMLGFDQIGNTAWASASDVAQLSALEHGFRIPPDSAKPWVFWWWLGGAASPAGLTVDLEAMKQQGISGALIFDCGIRGEDAPAGPLFMSAEWRENFRYAVREAARLGIELGVSLCSGYNAGGPWVTRENAIKSFVWEETTVNAGGRPDVPLPRYRQPPPTSAWASFTPCVETDYYRDVAVLACRETAGGIWKQTEVLDLTDALHDDRLRWRAPAGRWSILRIGNVVRGFDDSPNGGSHCTKMGSWPFPAWEIDPMSAEAMDLHFAETAAKLIADAGPHVGGSFKYAHIDSWELGRPSWTTKFMQEFRRLRQYDATCYLPALCGKIVDDEERTERFKHDYRRTVADLIAQNYYGRLTTLSHQHGLLTHSEAGGPLETHYIDATETEGRDDIPMGEFWAMDGDGENDDETLINPRDTPGVPRGDPHLASKSFLHPAALSGHREWGVSFGNIRQAVNAAHVYGKSLVQAESYTSYAADWTEDPYALKSFGDQAYCLGLNRQVLCYYVHQSTPNDKPGYEWEHVGTHFDRNVTWWPMSHGWLRYLARCQYLLQQGKPVADILYFAGEGIPNFATMYRKPVRGFDFDVINAEALVARLTTADGKLVLPDGTAYRYLVFPEQMVREISPAVLRVVAKLVEAGATLVGAPPATAPGLTDFTRSDREVRALVSTLWGDARNTAGIRSVGRGRVIAGMTVDEIIRADRLRPDLELRRLPRNAKVDWAHRKLSDADLYFLANLNEAAIETDAAFRVTGRTPELWDPVTGQMRDLTDFAVADGQTTVPLHFAPKQSWFVVFRNRGGVGRRVPGANFPTPGDLATLTGPWEVSFDEKWGGPRRAIFSELDDWSLREEDAIRHYSGMAVYRRTFDLPAGEHGEIYLNLGKVKNLARVRLNGVDLGVIWTAPWEVSIAKAVRRKKNRLEIEVVNLWPNRLIADGRLPKADRLTKTNVRTYDTPVRTDMLVCPECADLAKTGTPRPLLSSGLLGPVTLRAYGAIS